MIRYVQLVDNITAEQFGCDTEHFNKYIKGKPLRVTAATNNSVYVVDADGEAWMIPRNGFVDVPQPAIQAR